MKYLILSIGMVFSLGLSAQALDPEVAFAENVKKMNNIQQLVKMAAEAEQQALFARQEVVLKRLVELRPYSPELKLALVKAYAQQDKKTEAYNDLVKLQNAGLSYPVGDQPAFENIKGTDVFDYIEEGMANNAKPFGIGEKAFEVSKNYSGMLFENLVYDAKGQRFLLGSVRAGSVYQYTENGGFKEFTDPSNPASGPWGIIDLAIDQEADLLWIASATMPHYNGTTQANFGQAMVSKLDLNTGEVIKSFALNSSGQPMLFNNLHLSKNQNLYFMNAFGGEVYKIAKNSEQVEPLFKLSGMTAVKAITSNDKESIMYVSDYEQGLFVVNLETNQVVPLQQKPSGFFAGINDLFYDGGDLVAIQGGVQPARLMRYVLKQDLFLLNMFPIEAAHPSYESLGNGTLVGDEVYYTTNSQWAKTDGLGRLLPQQSWDDLVVMKSPTKYKMDEHMQRQQQMEEIKKKRGLK
ncbi:hypothetical protein OS175_04625 [Marinicella sp. S1101]|uniref:hypothetical protein n=1 Tax=Marinicella marina TaxID=2996016 RepID=UPI002260A31A|nr:hypothetical protein [Marinicella marina]MCX7553152.1 hypothetical protein [Marinicella marina]MDJ1138884.1 hypothetical protein [Marinicella marina]